MMIMVNMLLHHNRQAHMLEEERRWRKKESDRDGGLASLGRLLGHPGRTCLDIRKGEKE